MQGYEKKDQLDLFDLIRILGVFVGSIIGIGSWILSIIWVILGRNDVEAGFMQAAMTFSLLGLLYLATKVVAGRFKARKVSFAVLVTALIMVSGSFSLAVLGESVPNLGLERTIIVELFLVVLFLGTLLIPNPSEGWGFFVEIWRRVRREAKETRRGQ